jgi:hypothetical protein
VRQVGYLLELYRDARSPEYKMLSSNLIKWCRMVLGTVLKCDPAVGAISVCNMP